MHHTLLLQHLTSPILGIINIVGTKYFIFQVFTLGDGCSYLRTSHLEPSVVKSK